MRVCVYVFVCVCVCVNLYEFSLEDGSWKVWVDRCVCLCWYVLVCVCVCVHVYACTFTCDMTRVYMRHDLFMHVTCLIYTCDLFTRATCLIYTCGMTFTRVT